MTVTTTMNASHAGWQAFVDTVESEEFTFLEALIQRNATKGTFVTAGATITVAKLSASDVADAGGSLAVPVAGTEAEVVVQSSLFSELGTSRVVVTVSAFDPSRVMAMSSNRPSRGQAERAPVQVEAAVNVNIRSLSTGSILNVNGLSEAIQVVLPVNRSEGMQCAYWEEQRGAWATEGLYIGEGALGTPLVCMSSHLTLFGAILRGFLSSFECSQATLFNAEAISRLAKGDWYGGPGSIVLWAVLSVLLITLLLSIYVDVKRRYDWKWQDEHFLISRGKEGDEISEAHSKAEEAAEREARGYMACMCCTVAVCCCSIISWMKQFSAVNDALAAIREFFSGFCGGLDMGGAAGRGVSGRGFVLLHRTMCSLLESSARRQASASMHVSDEVLTFIMEDNHVCDILSARHERQRNLGLQNNNTTLLRDLPREGSFAQQETCRAPPPSLAASRASLDELGSTVGPATWVRQERRGVTVQREDVLKRLHEKASHHMHKHLVRCGTCTRLPFIAWRLFLVQNPFGAVFLHNIFMSSSLRAFFFMLDMMGALMVGTVLFESTGDVMGRESPARCSPEDPREQIGRLVAIGTSSIFLSGLPVALLHSMHRRRFKQIPYKGSPEWKRQLQIWRVRDRVMVLLGSLYLAFCTFFVCLYLANVSLEDSESFAISAAISVLEGAIIVPLFIALCVPLFAALSLSATSCASRVEKSELIRQRRAKLAESNLAVPRDSI